MTKSKRIFATVLVALSVFGLLLAAAYYSETAKMSTLLFFSAIGYSLTIYAFYKFLGESKRETAPTQKAYVAPVAYDYEADIGRIEKEVSKTVDEILAEENKVVKNENH